jgi:hypothetical protein
MVSLKGRKESE